MPVSTSNEVKQWGGDEHPVLKAGDFHVKGVIDHSAAGELCSEDAKLDAEVISLVRTTGGGIAYEFAITADEKPAQEAKKAKEAAAAAKAKADAAAQVKAMDDAAQARQDAADARLAKLVASAVREALASQAPTPQPRQNS